MKAIQRCRSIAIILRLRVELLSTNDFAYSNGRLINNTVTNIKNVTQTVNWKLEEMSEIGAQYRYGNYTFTNANKETGNKVVNLYYKFKTEKTFVVDFGLPGCTLKKQISTRRLRAPTSRKWRLERAFMRLSTQMRIIALIIS